MTTKAGELTEALAAALPDASMTAWVAAGKPGTTGGASRTYWRLFAIAILANPTFHEALTREVAEALHHETLGCFWDEEHERYPDPCPTGEHVHEAAAIVARLLGAAS